MLPRRASLGLLFRKIKRYSLHVLQLSVVELTSPAPVILGSEQREKEGGLKTVVEPSFQLRQAEPDVIDFK